MASLEFVARHVRYAVRLAIKSPGPTISMLLVLGLGIGAIASVLSLIGEVLLGPPRFAEPARLFTLSRSLSIPNALDLRAQAAAIEHLALADIGGDFSLTGVSQPRNLFGAAVTANFLRTLGVAPARGRDFTAEEEREGRHEVAILTSGLWRRAFDSDPSIVGRVVRLNDRPVRVVGVAPSDFRFGDVEIFRPLVFASFRDKRSHNDYMAVARLKSGVTVAQANANLQALAARLVQEYPQENAGLVGPQGLSLRPLDDGVANRTRGPLLMLLTAAVLVFLLVSVNVASLLLARGVSRRREFAVRTALGGGAGRLTGQLAIECTLLFVTAGLLGLLLAFACRGVLTTMAAPYFGPLFEPRLDWRVMACGLGLAAFAGVLCALAPALQARRAGVYDVLKEDSQSVMGGRASRWFSHAFVVAQIALAFILLVGTGLMLRTLAHLQQVPLGFEPAGALITSTRLPAAQFLAERRTLFAAQLLDRAQRLPGVMAAGITTDAPLRGAGGTRFVVDGRARPPAGKELDARTVAVSADYFRSLEIPLRRGRAFAASDVAGAPSVAIVSDTLAKTYFAGVDPIGQRIRLDDDLDVPLEIIGVVADIRQRSVTREPWPMVYRPFAQAPQGNVTLIVRTQSAQQPFVGRQLREVLDQLNPALAWTPITPMSDYIGSDAALVQRHFVMRLLGLFAAIALIVAALGIHGTLSYAVAQRTREIGLRVALGATPSVVVRDMLRRTMLLTVLGLVCGMAGALIWGRLLGTLLYGVASLDAVTYAAVSVLFAAAALAAAWWPARRAARVDPIQALRALP